MQILRVFLVLIMTAVFLTAGCTSDIDPADQQFVDTAIEYMESDSHHIDTIESDSKQKNWCHAKTPAIELRDHAQIHYDSLSVMEVTPELQSVKTDLLIAYDETHQYADATINLCNATESGDTAGILQFEADQKVHSERSTYYLLNMSKTLDNL